MQLVSFQIKECFGFRDSGEIDLQDPTNLIYVLGRNSSGKTSFLSALSYFAPNLTPQDYQNFKNFNSSTKTPYLIGKFRVGESDLSTYAFDRAFLKRMEELNKLSNKLLAAEEFRKLSQELRKKLLTFYTALCQRIISKGSMTVRRTVSGNYQFSTEPRFTDYMDRRRQVLKVLRDTAKQFDITVTTTGYMIIKGSSLPFLILEEIENLLALQLPSITFFHKESSLQDIIPDSIRITHLNYLNPLTDTLIKYLGKDRVGLLLKAENPLERRKLESELKEKIDSLVNKVNRVSETGTKFIAVVLDRSDGLQLTFLADNKLSYYRHLSENTRLLFAYQLYTTVFNPRATILLFDEPNNGFHATVQESLLAFLRDLGKAGNLVIISTHSEYLIDPDHLTGVRLMTADVNGYLSIRNKWYTSTSGSGDFQALRPILDAIGLRYGANHLTIHDKVIVTEGVTELLYLRAFRQLLGYECELHIAPATGDKTIRHVIALLISQGLHFKVVVDATVDHKSTKDELQEEYDIPGTSIYEVEVPTGFPEAKASGIEDIFSKAGFARLLTKVENKPGDDFETLSNSQYMKKHKKDVPKRVVAHEFNKQIANYRKNDFDKETLTNMRRVLDFCMNDDWFLL